MSVRLEEKRLETPNIFADENLNPSTPFKIGSDLGASEVLLEDEKSRLCSVREAFAEEVQHTLLPTRNRKVT